ncbi:putative sugar nucleotidyl transferase [Chitinophaga sp. YIM B06452]|uniref:putative sugar nucleotidyl transferase n=1 Tax=Chitinophaga sp. YIM B06452 TaxID=3082158 RepID=UPI0031FE7607
MNPHYILFDTPERDQLFPFTHTRPVAACRIGLLSIREKWEKWLGTSPISYFTMDYLQDKFPLIKAPKNAITILLNGHLLPSAAIVEEIGKLQPGQELYKNGRLLAKSVSGDDFFVPTASRIDFEGDIIRIDQPWHIAQYNDAALREDFALLTKGRKSAPISQTNRVENHAQIFLEPGAKVEHSVLNASTGPIYIGKNAEVMEGCLIRGPFGMGEHAVLKMGARVYGATSIGHRCVAGGEIKNSVLFDHSNKAHDGYLGDAVIGEWCNLGANTSCSNLKNNAREVRVWMEAKQETWSAGIKCGVIMGDYSRCGINTMFNTGTVVGVSCNVFGSNFPPKSLPSFSWGGAGLADRYRLEEALRDADSWMQLKGASLSEQDRQILTHIFQG